MGVDLTVKPAGCATKYNPGFRVDFSLRALRLGTGKLVDTWIRGGLLPVIRV